MKPRASTTMGSAQFCLELRRHPSDAAAALKLAPCVDGPTDVVLVCEGFFLNASKAVLSAFSSFFREQFVADPSKETTVIPNGVSCSDLETLVEFMYHGEVVVEKGQLPSLLKAAETLKVKSRLVFTRGGRSGKDRVMLAKGYAAGGETPIEPRCDSPPSKRQCLGLERRASSRTNLNGFPDLDIPSTSRTLDCQRPMIPLVGSLPNDHCSTILALMASRTCAEVPSAASTPSSIQADFVKNAAKFSSPRATASMTSDISGGSYANHAAASDITSDIECPESSLLTNSGNTPQRMFSAVQLNLSQPSSCSEMQNSDPEHIQPLPGISMTRYAPPMFSPVGVAASGKDNPSGASMKEEDNLWEMVGYSRHYREDKQETVSSHLPDRCKQGPSGTDYSCLSERKECLLPSSTATTTQPQRPHDSSAVFNTDKLIVHPGEECAPAPMPEAQKRGRGAKRTAEAAGHRPVTRSMTTRQQKH